MRLKHPSLQLHAIVHFLAFQIEIPDPLSCAQQVHSSESPVDELLDESMSVFDDLL